MTATRNILLHSILLPAILLSICIPSEGQIFKRTRQDAIERLEQSRDSLSPSASRARKGGSSIWVTSNPRDAQLQQRASSQSQTPQVAAQGSSKKSKKQLSRENDALHQRLDSLETLLQDYERRIAISDSLAGELIDMYSENENKSGMGLYNGEYTADVTDSLLSVWYLHRQVQAARDSYTFEELDTVRFSSNVPDEVYMRRLAKMNSFITLPYNQTVKNYIILYSEKMPSRMSSMLALAQYYFPIFENVLNKEGMPDELKYMAVIESALNPVAVSRANAKGMWQFMHTTAKNYNLTINSYVDERFDPVASAEAAAQYMKDAYSIFGDWALAISSYNCGAGNVNKAIRRAGGRRDFWSIYEYLPRETRGYVPAFVGAMYAFTYYKEHGIVPETLHLPAHVDTFHVSKMLHFRQVSDLTGAPLETLRELNPQYIHDIIPGNERTYILNLPYTFTNAFIDNEDTIYNYMADSLFAPSILRNVERGRASSSSASGNRTVYRVKSGDTLSKIAARYRVSLKDLKSWNHISGSSIRVGQRLYIYGRGGGSSASASSSSSSKSSSSATASKSSSTSSSASSGGYITYTVKRGDTISGIASRYRISQAELKRANGMSGNSLRAGQKLKIPQK